MLTTDVLIRERKTSRFSGTSVSVLQKSNRLDSGSVDTVAAIDDVTVKIDLGILLVLIQRKVGQEDADHLIVDALVRDDYGTPVLEGEWHDNICSS